MERKIISFLLQKNNIDFWEISFVIGYLRDFVKSVKKLQKERIVKIEESKLILTPKGKKAAKILDIFPSSMSVKGLEKIKIDKNLLRQFKKQRKRIKEKVAFDQLQITPESVVKKIGLMKIKEDLFGKKIICLGDDDFCAIALALTKLPQEIAVIDIDGDILNYEKRVLSKLGCRFKTIKHSLLNPIPKALIDKYDVFVTEPPDTVEGNTIFFSRGAECLKKEGGVGYIGISQNDLPRWEIAEIQKNILKMNMVITNIFDKFSLYEIAKDEFSWIFGLPEEISLPKKPWFSSNLLRTETTKKTKPLIRGAVKDSFKEKIFQTRIFC